MASSKLFGSFQVFEFESDIDDSIIEAFAAKTIPPIETLRDEPISGWVSPRYLLDTEITDETCKIGRYYHLSLAKAERRIPASLLKAYCRMEEIAYMREQGVTSLSPKVRAEIKLEVKKQMLPKMPPQLSGIDVAVDSRDNRVYADALTEKTMARLTSAYADVAHAALVQMSPANAALRLFNVRTDELAPVSFSPEHSEFVVNDVGLDFLMWLFYKFETGAAEFTPPSGETLKVSLDGPVTLVLEAQGAHRVTLRDGVPLNSVEMRAALMGGKKISAVNVVLQVGSEVFAFALDGMEFIFRSVKYPTIENSDKGDHRIEFSDGITMLQRFIGAFYSLYGVFLNERTNTEVWHKLVADFRKWLPTYHVEA